MSILIRNQLKYRTCLKYLAFIALLAPIAAKSEEPMVLPSVPERVEPLPNVPKQTERGMPFLGFGYACKVQAGVGESALNGKIEIHPSGELGQVTAETAKIPSNPFYVKSSGKIPKGGWYPHGALHWKINWSAYRSYILHYAGDVSFELTAEKSLPKTLFLSFTRNSKTHLIVQGYAQKNKAYFISGISVILGYGGDVWMVDSWPYKGENIPTEKHDGYGNINLDPMRSAVTNIDKLNSKFREIIKDYKNLCEAVPYYEEEVILI